MGRGSHKILKMLRASASGQGDRTGPTGTGFSLEVPGSSQVTQSGSETMLFPGCVTGARPCGGPTPGAEMLEVERACPWVGLEGSPPPTTWRGLGPCPLSLVLVLSVGD